MWSVEKQKENSSGRRVVFYCNVYFKDFCHLQKSLRPAGREINHLLEIVTKVDATLTSVESYRLLELTPTDMANVWCNGIL
jgi:hypothetical protein